MLIGRETMSLVPEFELGLWNAWILMLPLIIASVFGARIFVKRGSEEESDLTGRERMLEGVCFACMHLLVVASYVYSVFLPLKLGTAWFYVGLFIYLPGILTLIVAILNFATTPVDEPVTQGIYRFSRNPMYVGEFLVNIGIGVSCLSWIFFLVAVVVAVLQQNIVVAEERFCLKKYRDQFREYMDRTPRWIGIPRLGKSD